MIKALYDYSADNPDCLSFSEGDFLHVTGREFDTEWYEACNPLLGTRGLVPVTYFDQIGRKVRDSRDSDGAARGSGNHDSGYSEQRVTSGDSPATTPSTSNPGSPPQQQPYHQQNRMSRAGSKSAAPVYGVVAYDFKAERPDELDAKEGEAIIVIAQSNPEWFVAKPITRLGGPGLIPVSFIEIKDMQTGQTVSDTAAAVAKAGIPKVEEWKKMAADYKNTSIPLGQIGPTVPAGQVDSLQQGMDRMSIGGQQNGHGHVRSQSTFSQGQSHYGLPPLCASVPRYLYADDKFHFVVEVTLSDNTHWDLTRIYEDFYELQINLIKAFPDEAGATGAPRTLPLMPGPVQFVTDRITEGRRENLDEYLYKLLNLGAHIVNSALVRGFFSPRNNDYECDSMQISEDHSYSAYAPGGPHHNPAGDRYSSASHASMATTSPPTGGPSSHMSNPSSSYAPAHQRGQSSLSNGSGSRAPTAQSHYRTPSDVTYADRSLAPAMTRNTTQTSTVSSSGASTLTAAGANSNAGSALKVKVWFDRDTCVVLRLPPRGSFSFADLHRKIMERRRLEYNRADVGAELMAEEEEGLWIEYRDEISGEYFKLDDDASLGDAVSRCEKLTLVVRDPATQ